jgi:hypothetical protein
MRLSLSILAPLLACSNYTQSLPAPIPTSQGTIIKKLCRTDNPSSELRKAHENLQTQGSQLKARKANSFGQLLVDTHIHFVTTQDQALIYGMPGVSDRLISSQVNLYRYGRLDAELTPRLGQSFEQIICAFKNCLQRSSIYVSCQQHQGDERRRHSNENGIARGQLLSFKHLYPN